MPAAQGCGRPAPRRQRGRERGWPRGRRGTSGGRGERAKGRGSQGTLQGKRTHVGRAPGRVFPPTVSAQRAGRPPGRGEAGNGVTCNSKGGKAPASGAKKKKPVSVEAGAGSPCREPSGQSALCPASRHVPGEAARPGSFSFG